MRRTLEFVLPICAVAVLGHLLVLKTWWFHDDWVFLADAAGITPRGNSLVRFVSYQAYWSLFYPLFGLTGWAWGLTRLALHAWSSVLVARLGLRAGLDRHGAILAGLLMAAAPVAFESLYWGTGAIELLGAAFALAALDRWLAGGRRNRWTALLLAALAVGSKESGLLLAIVFGLLLVREGRWRSALGAGVLALAGLAVAAVVLMRADFATTADYAVDLVRAPRNFLVYGAWLVTPGPLLRDAALFSVVAPLLGAAVWLIWGGLAWRPGRPQRTALLLCFALAVLAVAPATVLGDHAVPRYLYAPYAALVLSLVLLLFPERGPSRASLAVVTVLLLAGAWSGVRYQLDARHVSGRPLHRLVFKEEVSRVACRTLGTAPLEAGDRVVFVAAEHADPRQVALLRETLLDDLAVRLLTDPTVTVAWKTAPGPEDRGAYGFIVRGAMLQPGRRLGGVE